MNYLKHSLATLIALLCISILLPSGVSACDGTFGSCSSKTSNCGKNEECKKIDEKTSECGCRTIQPTTPPSPTPTPPPGQIQGRRLNGCPASAVTTLVVKDGNTVLSSTNLTGNYLDESGNVINQGTNTYNFNNLPRNKFLTVSITPPNGYAALFSLSIGNTSHLISSWTQGDSVQVYLPSDDSTLFYGDLHWKCIPTSDSQQLASKPANKLWQYFYNQSGSLYKQIDPKANTEIFFDNLNRITSQVVNGITTLTNEYDNCPYGLTWLCTTKSYSLSDGKLLTTEATKYNERGQTAQGSLTLTNMPNAPINNLTLTSVFTYEEGGRVLTETLSGASTLGIPDETITHKYSKTNEVEIIGQDIYAKEAKFNLDGQMVSFLSGNNITNSFSYNPQNLRLQNLKVTGANLNPSDVIDLAYTYELAGNIKQITDNNSAKSATDPFKLTQNFTYDAFNRLSSVGGAYTANYAYDDLNNILTKVEGPNNVSLTYDPNPLSGFYHRPKTGNVLGKATNFAYDNTGNMLTDTQNTYAYDAQGRLIQAVVPQPSAPATPSPTLVISPIISASPSATPTLPPNNGDANGDTKVDQVDYQIWKTNYAVSTLNGPSVGDFNYDQKVDGIDYAIWRKGNLSQATPAPTNGPSPLPSSVPTITPTKTPTINPTPTPAPVPSTNPTPTPAPVPTTSSTPTATPIPTSKPTPTPTTFLPPPII